MSNQRPVKTPSRIVVRVDETGITASNGRGGEIRYAASSVSPGFNPLELQSAALAMCTAITLRNELRELGTNEVLTQFEVAVEGVKAQDLPSRLARMEVVLKLPPGLPESSKAGVVQRAERACTIANTLHAPTQIVSEF